MASGDYVCCTECGGKVVYCGSSDQSGVTYCYVCHGLLRKKMEQALLEAERRGEERGRKDGFISGWEACISNEEFDGLSMEAHLDQYLQNKQASHE